MSRNESLLPVAKFIAEYSAHMMGCGVHTSRVVRSSKRIGEAYGADVKISIFQKNIILTISDNDTKETYSEVIDIPALPISFEKNAKLSALSWETYDKHLSLEELKDKYEEIIASPHIDPLFVLILVGFANASFCRLFGGDITSMGIVFSETTDADTEIQSLHNLRGIGLYCIALCLYSVDIRHDLGHCTGNERPVPDTGRTADQWGHRYCRRVYTDRFCPAGQCTDADYLYRDRAFFHINDGKK